jgi:hypothetical protein
MKYLLSILSILVITCPTNIFSQFYYCPLNKEWNVRLENTVKDTLNYHSTIKPITLQNIPIDSTLLNFSLYQIVTNKKIQYRPITNFSISNSKSNFSYETEIGTSLFVRLGNKLSIQSNIFGNFSKYNPYISEKIDSYKVVPDWGKALYDKSGSYFVPVITGSINYQPGKYVALSVGYDKYFIGDGYRSLLLSDNAAPYPFLRLKVNFWRLEYFLMWAYLKDIDNNSCSAPMVDKFGVFHYLDLNLTNRLSVGFYESIIWWGSDTDTKRGFDPSYLNPIIFFRPIEYSIHSPDNANLGGNIKLRIWRKTYLYGQLFIDDLMVKELLNNTGWWGNKYGIQAGFKTHNLFTIKNLYVQSEINVVRPFMYSHISSSLNYGTVYHPLAHPLGANFVEMLGIVRYSKARWSFMAKLAVAKTGVDTSKISYGQNIYKSFYLRDMPNDHNSYILQGKKEMPLFSELKCIYLANKKWGVNIFCSIKGYSKDFIKEKPLKLSFNLGITTLLYNNERDY